MIQRPKSFLQPAPNHANPTIVTRGGLGVMNTSTVPKPATTPTTFPHANQYTKTQTTPPPLLQLGNAAHSPLATILYARDNNAPDLSTLMLLGVLFLLVGILSYALRTYLYTYHPPHVPPSVASPASSPHGWRGQRLLDKSEGEGDYYGWPWYPSQGLSTIHTPNPSSSHYFIPPPPPPPPPHPQRRKPSSVLKKAPPPPHPPHPQPPPPPPTPTPRHNRFGRSRHQPPLTPPSKNPIHKPVRSESHPYPISFRCPFFLCPCCP